MTAAKAIQCVRLRCSVSRSIISIALAPMLRRVSKDEVPMMTH
jgi:hypothetical protein